MALPAYFSFFFQNSGDHRDLHSFPTRRSSDLGATLVSVRQGRHALRAATDDPMATLRNRIALIAGAGPGLSDSISRSEEHTSELQSQFHLVCRLLLEKKNNINNTSNPVSYLPD